MWNSLGCSILCIHSIPFSCMCARARETPTRSPLRSLESQETAFGGGGNHFRSGEFGQSSSGLRATYRARAQIFLGRMLSRAPTHETYCKSLGGHPEFMSGGEEELYLHNPRAAAAVWFWLACHYWCGTERSLSLCHSSTKLLLMGIGRTDGRTTKPRPRRREGKREMGRRFKTYGAEEASFVSDARKTGRSLLGGTSL